MMIYWAWEISLELFRANGNDVNRPYHASVIIRGLARWILGVFEAFTGIATIFAENGLRSSMWGCMVCALRIEIPNADMLKAEELYMQYRRDYNCGLVHKTFALRARCDDVFFL